MIIKNTFHPFIKILMSLFILGIILSLAGCEGYLLGILNPKGVIAEQERKLFFDTMALMLIVVLPVIIMSLAFVYHYQVSHRIRDYKPHWAHNYFLEALWWGIPCAIIVVLAILTWNKTHELDPSNQIANQTNPPLLVQVIALPWKWLFIYPEQNIATVNYLQIPLGQQVEYRLTADNVPMSAFFIPQLGSQIYVMAGMRSRLHLIANETGIYDGLNTQYNGDGFSDMHFSVHVVPPEQMQSWYEAIKKSPLTLTQTSYTELLQPSIKNQPQFYASVEDDFFNHAISTYMHTFGKIHPRGNEFKLEE